MMSAGMWRQMRALETAALINSTKAGQNLINGVRRPQVGVLRPTKSNPRGICMAQSRPHTNPLLNLRTTSHAIDNMTRQASGIRINQGSQRRHIAPSISQTAKWVPLVDCVRHNAAKAVNE
jgi:hypothetical protein